MTTRHANTALRGEVDTVEQAEVALVALKDDRITKSQRPSEASATAGSAASSRSEHQ